MRLSLKSLMDISLMMIRVYIIKQLYMKAIKTMKDHTKGSCQEDQQEIDVKLQIIENQ